jgi:hypothetical protein
MTALEERKKRVADRQITKDDREEDNDDEEEQTEPSQGFPKADEETLKKRRMVKVRKSEKQITNHDGDEEKKSSNPFASISKSTGSVFGSGYGGGFGAAQTGTGFGFGGGFGRAQAGTTSSTASVFGSSTAFSGGLESTASSESAFGTTVSSSARSEQQVATFPEEAELRTGEEDEDVIFTVRAKSHILVDKKEVMQEEVTDDAPSVPPSSLNTLPAETKENGTKEKAAEESKATDADQAEASDEKPNDSQEESSEKKEGLASAKEETTADAQSNGDEKKKRQEWRELGIGPLRILKKDKCHTRVVQRRESAPGGAGTKLLINAPLPKESEIGRPSDQHIRFTTIEPSGKAAIYLLKVKTKSEADQLQKVLEVEISQAKSFVGGN